MDGAMRSALGRLTDNEKECLRRRLRHQTAKEMAIDLGVSPHAVEKRLKMARTKLGVSSSLVAARLLVAAEAGRESVPLSPDLPDAVGAGDRSDDGRPTDAPPTPARIGLLMLTALCLIATAVAQDAPVPDTTPTMRKVGMDEAAAFIRAGFPQKDRDGSGDLDPDEAAQMEPRDAGRDPALPPAPAPGMRDPAAERKWMARLDTNRDGRVSQAEYVGYLLPWILWQGVPAAWHADAAQAPPRR